MSRTYEVVCHDCQVSLWCGQGSQGKFHLYFDGDHGKQLTEFLHKHIGHRLQLLDSEVASMLDYEEIPEPGTQVVELGTAIESDSVPTAKPAKHVAVETAEEIDSDAHSR